MRLRLPSPAALLSPALLATLGMAALLLLSSNALTFLGFRYVVSGGSFLEKLHPGTLLFAGAVLALALRAPGPFALANRIVLCHKGMVCYFAALAFFFGWLTLVVGQHPSFVADTFLLPALAFVVLAGADPAEAGRKARLLHFVMALNAAIGIAEVTTGLRLIPTFHEGEAIQYDWRASALLGHPLANACLTGCYTLLLALGGGRLSPAWRIALIALQLMAMPAFGGRASTLGTLLILAGLLLTRLAPILAGCRFSIAAVAGIVCGGPLVLLAGAALAETGYLDQFIGRFVDDGGSSQARITMFRLFDHLRMEELVLGPNPARLGALAWAEGLEYGIESFPVALLVEYGAIATAVLLAGLVAFLVDLHRQLDRRAVLCTLFFLGVNLTSVGLAAKTTSFGIFVIMCVLLLPRQGQPSGPGPR